MGFSYNKARTHTENNGVLDHNGAVKSFQSH